MDDKPNEANTLRAEAEARVTQNQINLVNPQPGEELLHKLLHELRVHQIELEIQNEALRQAHLAMEESRDRYVDLYDFAPIAYLTVSREGMISEINLTGADLLGVVRSKLVSRRFSQFVAAEDRDRWYTHFAGVLKHEQRQHCELTFLREDDSRFRARVDSLRARAAPAQATDPHSNEGGAFSVRLAITEIPALVKEE
ncbi:MAG: PAS domain-containing protein [Sideroxyarcus sp.]|nr:PAS domain-containing protein [Sideroxyarcus sp.]